MIANPKYHIDDIGNFVITNYNISKTFSSFFPGIAGQTGIPIWAFYVNRGQCVCSMGIQDKDNPIMEFLPANRAYQLVASQGFRTFLKFKENGDTLFYEPFQNHLRDEKIDKTQEMVISSSKLKIIENNLSFGIHTSVDYTPIPEDNFGGIIRKLTIGNIGSRKIMIEGLDGLPLIIPYGLNDIGLKQMRRLMEAFVEVVNHENNAPVFKCKVEPADRPDVTKLIKGNFYLGMEVTDGRSKLLQPVVDPFRIFGALSDYSYPKNFIDNSIDDLLDNQIFENRLPSAMSTFNTTLNPGEEYELYSIIGHIESVDKLNDVLPTIANKKYCTDKAILNKKIINTISHKNKIISNNKALNLYTEQNFLDNVLRGGFPYSFKNKDNKSILHLYARKHGDLERDYNFFRITPTKFSQGNGNYRDINQNRRSDLLFNPDVLEKNIEQFCNIIQLDGFNPLVLKEVKIIAKDEQKIEIILEEYFDKDSINQILSFLRTSITPGDLIKLIEDNYIEYKGELNSLVSELLNVCEHHYDTDHAEGYWSDHWTYILDLVENYLSVFPEKAKYLLFEKKSFTFHDSPYVVVPRQEKYMLWENKPMQLDSVKFDSEKNINIEKRPSNKNLVRIKNSNHESVYRTTLINKLLSLVTIKMASLDPEGIGIEMESDKPNWYDALNGLPGLFGSSINETLELKRLIVFLLSITKELEMKDERWQVYSELKELIINIKELLKIDITEFNFWNQASYFKENYREQIRCGLLTKEEFISTSEITKFLELCINKIEKAISKAWNDNKSIISTYFRYEIIDYDLIYENGQKKLSNRELPCFNVNKFKRVDLPLFLEGPVHYLRNMPGKDKSRSIVNAIKNSDLYDSVLKMYKVNTSLSRQPMEIGRNRTFSPGWFENESVWLHMEYKYMLELLRNELYDEFYSDFKNVFIPFLNSEQYGRSILENSSFIVSSANPDKSLHGRGFVSRLSGATAEFIHILQYMMVGKNPFFLNSNKNLCLRLSPALPNWLFTEKDQEVTIINEDRDEKVIFPKSTFGFVFLSSILVVYHNPNYKNTFGNDCVLPSKWIITDINNQTFTYSGTYLKDEIVEQIRDRQVNRIDVHLT